MLKRLLLLISLLILSLAVLGASPIGLTELVNDLSPQLGGNLDLNTHEITVKAVDTIYASAWLNGASPPEVLSVLTSTYKVEIRNFDPTADEDVYFTWDVPFDFTGSTITYRVIMWVSNATGPSAEDICWFLQGASVADGELLSSAHGTAVESKVDESTHSQYDRIATAWSNAVTITGIAAGETATMKLYRDADGSASDEDYEQDVGGYAVQIKYSVAKTND